TFCEWQPGGCELGPRPIDLHLSSLAAMGYEVGEEGGRIVCRGKGKPSEIHLSFPSVGATENIMLAAAGIPGVTRIVNAAREPEIGDLASFLRKGGVRVEGDGSSVIHIEGGRLSSSPEHAILPDRIAAATYLSALAAAGGDVTLHNVVPAHFSSVTSLLETAGCRVQYGADSLTLHRGERFSPFYTVRTMPYPGFPTDAQAVLMATAIKGKGVSAFTENIFDARFGHAGEMKRMGADIRIFGRSALVFGVDRLCGAAVTATDLRGGAALIIAALASEGESTIDNMKYVRRGYEDIVGDLQGLGADIRYI
ncbi:MAG: UDP-N-acetylglucosamine 1-carboxyvinyltransferase, partial [Clostridia bacterium]|nr:UDP-N-acetylglucosamine 1-carboxyvinyltransferase [Clostridia bacterium]